jgi:hypothetical protein
MVTPTLPEWKSVPGLCVKAGARACRAARRRAAALREAVASDRAHRRAAAAIAEQRERIDGNARSANVFEHGPERLRHAFEMSRLEWTGERDRKAILAFVVARGGGEILEGRRALGCEPIEPGRCLHGAQHEKAPRARERQRSGRQWRPPLREIDEARLDCIEPDIGARGKRRLEQSMQTDVAARHRSEPREARGAETGIGERLQRDAVIGAAEP